MIGEHACSIHVIQFYGRCEHKIFVPPVSIAFITICHLERVFLAPPVIGIS
jgi:hypothetical protein